MFKKFILCTFLLFLCSNVYSSQNIKFLPSEQQWLNHAKLLEKFWLVPDAYGNPIGKFPTWRCNDGTLRNGKKCNDESKDPEFMPIINFDYVRMMSRQTFGYGALFNLTGNPDDLKLHQAGVKFLLEKAKDPDGGFYSIFVKDDTSYPSRLARTAQDLSYALVGLAMNAYLTNDPDTIKVIMDTQKYIYSTYYDPKTNLLKWCFEDSYFDKKEQLELVAQLDQLNAYLLLTWRLIPKAEQKKWTNTIKKTIKMINDHFYVKNGNKFWGCIDNNECFNTETGKHLDYGHRVKSFWMEYLAARGTKDSNLEEFAIKGIKDTLNEALANNKIEWFESNNKEQASWWVYAELDQSALTLALEDKYTMPNTLFNWINDRTDQVYGEMNDGLKTHFWRSAFHSTEHALVGYITSQGIRANYCKQSTGCLRDNQVNLYFAPAISSSKMVYTPYLYSGNILSDKQINKGLGIHKVTFNKIHAPMPVK